MLTNLCILLLSVLLLDYLYRCVLSSEFVICFYLMSLVTDSFSFHSEVCVPFPCSEAEELLTAYSLEE